MITDKWHVRFIEMARHVAQWSKDPSTKCGAVIIDPFTKKVMGLGFNGFAAHTDDSSERYKDRDKKYEGVIHCEENAIYNASQDLKGAAIYITATPCGACAARIIQNGIMQVIIPYQKEDPFYYRKDWDRKFAHATEQFKDADVHVKVLSPTAFDVRDLMGPEHPHVQTVGRETTPHEVTAVKQDMFPGAILDGSKIPHTNYEKVLEFHKKFKLHMGRSGNIISSREQMLRTRLMQEEGAELTKAMQQDDYPNIAKELADYLYTVYGTAAAYGMPMDEIFNAVHESNMTKDPAIDTWGKIKKGLDYEEPDIESVLLKTTNKGTR